MRSLIEATGVRKRTLLTQRTPFRNDYLLRLYLNDVFNDVEPTDTLTGLLNPRRNLYAPEK